MLLPAGALPRQLIELRRWLVAQAERGTGGASPGAFGIGLAGHHRALRAVGFPLFAVEGTEEPAVALLRSLYLTLQVTQLLTGE